VVTADDAAMGYEQRDGIGKKMRTAEYIGGGTMPGKTFWRDCRRRKSAAIGAAAGAGAGAGRQVLT